jgi:hypothetical protein
MNINLKEYFGIISIILTFMAYTPYIRSIFIGKTKPHVFTWIIWGLTTFIVFLAQLTDNGGAGAWATGVSSIVIIFIVLLTYFKKLAINITKSDWIFFFLALSAIPFWHLTNNPLWTIAILSCIDTIGFFPTIRKAYIKPFEENLILYSLLVIRNVTSIIALEYYSLITLLFPSTVAVTCSIFIFVVLFKRREKKLMQAKKSALLEQITIA